MNTFSLRLKTNFIMDKIPNAVKDEFIDIASSSLSPETFDFLTLSEPARSTKYKIEVMIDVLLNAFCFSRANYYYLITHFSSLLST